MDRPHERILRPPPGSPPTWLVQGSATAEANRIKWQAGGVPIGASDNTPALAPLDSTAGPPWVIGVAGDHPEGEGACREPVSGNLPDFTADFTQTLPLDGTIDAYRETSGTSFATPMTAGVLSRVLLEVRQAWNHTGGITDVMDDTGHTHRALAWNQVDHTVSPQYLDNVLLREALNRTATYFTTAVACDTPGSVPVNPAAPWLQQGWGHVGPELVETAVDCILEHFGRFLDPCPQKPDAAVAYMDAIHRERQPSWGQTP